MSFALVAIFSTPDDDSSPDFSICDFISDSDWTNTNYWNDIGSCVSDLIHDGEDHLSSLFPNGHDYSLTCVHVLSIDFDLEEVNTH